MSFRFSIVIICKNEAENVGRCLESLRDLSKDIVVYDSGSTDATLEIVKGFRVRLHTGPWEGFGKTRQKAVELARHDWVLIIDADEVLTEPLRKTLRFLEQPFEHTAFKIHLKNHLGNRRVRWGAWGHDYRIRLYNRRVVRWNDLIVHEKLILPPSSEIIFIHQSLNHYTAKDFTSFAGKMRQYAILTAEQYLRLGKSASIWKRIFGPGFAFFKSYFLKLGFLDGATGFRLARIIASYTALKYKRLKEAKE